ncbi:DUF3854 domain-containing protein [Leptolyngbya sp. PL-A3]|uniref:DUF3854 domain-containing protein n=1 Tax=Leptolyngbya sp. PL-A3 TaxID=2933911 RepID=UPI003296924D
MLLRAFACGCNPNLQDLADGAGNQGGGEVSYPTVLEEFRKSAIPDRLTLANVKITAGDEAIEILLENSLTQVQGNSVYVTAPATRMMARYEFLQEGAWYAHGCRLDGSRGEVVYMKPFAPRKVLENGRIKTIKYETPPKCEALPILPHVDEETAQELYRLHKVTPLESETFWQCWLRCNLPIGITEGLKKALSMTAKGLPTIALRGIACWHRKGSPELHEAIAHFATPSRKIKIAFDQDEKPKTQRDVRTQALKLGAALELVGCQVSVLMWSTTDGKGIDDAIAGKGEQGQVWFNSVVKDAPSLHDYRKYGRVAMAIATIDRLNQLTYAVERATEGEYMPELPELIQGMLHVIFASMNAGKTTRVGTDWVKWAIAAGWNVLVLTPINNLGGQTSTDWGLPHINDDKDPQKGIDTRQLWEEVKDKGGIVMCGHSLPKIPLWFWDRPVLLVFDEANQVIHDLTAGDTLGSRYQTVFEHLAAAARHAIETGAIVASEDGIPDRAVRFLQQISGLPQVRVVSHQKQGQSWDCTVYTNQPSGYRARLIQAVKSDRHLIVTSSQREGRRMDKSIQRLYPSLKVVRIDSETNQKGEFRTFFDSPDDWLQQHKPDVLILSPSAKSGVSIEGSFSIENAYFSKVWGYFPALDTDAHMQMLGRYRPPVPRIIFVPQFIMASGDEFLMNPRTIQRRLNTNLRAISGLYSLGEVLEASERRDENLLQIEAAVLEYVAESKAVMGAQKAIAHDALVRRLEKAGHRVQCVKIGKDSHIIELWKDVQEEIWREDAATMAKARLLDEHTPKWAQKTLDSHEASLEVRIVAQKVLLREEFPGIDFDDPEDCYQILFQDFGSMRRGVSLQARAENLEATKELERKMAEGILKGSIRPIHRLPKNYVRAWFLAKTGVLNLLDGQRYSNQDPRAIAVKKAALYYANEIHYWLRLQIKPGQTPVDICNKLLGKLDIEKKNGTLEVARPGRRGEQSDRFYCVNLEISPVRAKLLKAAQQKLSSPVSTIRSDQDPTDLQIVDTAPNSPSFEGLPPDIADEYRTAWQTCTSNKDKNAIRESVEGFAEEVRRQAA